MAGVTRTSNTSQFVDGAGGAYPQNYNSANTSYIPEIWAN